VGLSRQQAKPTQGEMNPGTADLGAWHSVPLRPLVSIKASASTHGSGEHACATLPTGATLGHRKPLAGGPLSPPSEDARVQAPLYCRMRRNPISSD
jgi:hypothetical protein